MKNTFDFEDIKSHLQDGFQKAAKYSDNFMQSSRIKVIINKKMSELQEVYKEIGEKQYKKQGNEDNSYNFSKLYKKADKIENEIQELEKELKKYSKN